MLTLQKCARWLFLKEKSTPLLGFCKEQNRKRCIHRTFGNFSGTCVGKSFSTFPGLKSETCATHPPFLYRFPFADDSTEVHERL